MGIEFKSPGDKGYNPYGKKHQTHVSGWGCIVYPLFVIIITIIFLTIAFGLTLEELLAFF